MSSLIKPLFRLMIGTFIFAMLMPVSTTWAGPPDENGCHDHKQDCGSSGSDTPKYTVTLTGDLEGASASGGWSGSKSGGKFIGLDDHLPHTNTAMTLDLSFFETTPSDNGCFNFHQSSTQTPLFAANLEQKNIRGGAKQAIGSFWFLGVNRDFQNVNYILTIFGTFSNPGGWPGADTLTMDYWEMGTASGNGNASDTACTSEGDTSIGGVLFSTIISVAEEN